MFWGGASVASEAHPVNQNPRYHRRRNKSQRSQAQISLTSRAPLQTVSASDATAAQSHLTTTWGQQVPPAHVKDQIVRDVIARHSVYAQNFQDGDIVTVLYGYGRVAPRAVSWLDSYRVDGGVIHNVPYAVAKHWKAGTRPDGKVPASKVNITIVPHDLPETEYAHAAGLTASEMQRWSSYLTLEDARDIIARIPADVLGQLKSDIDRRLTPPRF